MFIRSIVLASALGCSAAFAPASRMAQSTALNMAAEHSTEDRRSFVAKVCSDCMIKQQINATIDHLLAHAISSLDLPLQLL